MTKSKLQAKLGTLRRKIGNSQPGHKPEQQEPDDKGNALLWVLLAMAITAILLVTAGPSLLDLLRGARESSLQTSFSGAVQSVNSRIQAEPEWMSEGFTGASGAPTTDFIATLTRDGGDYTWQPTWQLPAPGSAVANNIYVQFLEEGSTIVEGAPGPPVTNPEVPWMLRNGTAIRLQAANEDNTWVCALLVFRPTLVGVTPTAAMFLDDAGQPGIPTAPANATARLEANLSGTWYETGASYTAADSHDHCSPVGHTGAVAPLTVAIYLPSDTNNWRLDTNGTIAGGERHMTRKP